MADADAAPDPRDRDEAVDESLETVKRGRDGADNESVNEGIGARPRMSWDPVTDSGGGSRTLDEVQPGQSGFHFDLGGALAKLGGAVDADEDAGSTPAGPAARADEIVVEEPVVFEPEPVVVEPDPVAVESETVVVEPDPVAVESETVVVEPDPVAVESETVVAESEPDVVEPEPIVAESESVLVEPDEPLPPLPQRRARHTSIQPSAQPVPPPAVTDEQRMQAYSVDEVERSQPAAHRSVFDDGNQNAAPMIPGAPGISPGPEQQASLPATSSHGGPTLPTLPAAMPVAPMVAPVIETSASAPDIQAFRSAQMRSSRRQTQGKLFGRGVLALLGMAALIALALIFGRSYLFPTEWDAELTPLVDEIQETNGEEFDHAVPLVAQPADVYAGTVLGLTIGDSWVSDVPEWRALGLAVGETTPETVGSEVALARPVVYDPATETIYRSSDVPAVAAADGLRIALEQAYIHQVSAETADSEVPVTAEADELSEPEQAPTRFAGVSLADEIVDAAIDGYLITGASSDDRIAATGLAVPIPIAYEFAAIDRLGEPILTAVGVDPGSISFGDDYPDAVYEVLDDAPRRAFGGVVKPGDVPAADPVALGVDDWSLVWGARLPPFTVDRLIDAVSADSYRPFDRSGTRCFVAIFRSTSSADDGFLLSAMSSWAVAAPVESVAVVTELGPGSVQLEACDPGAAVVPAFDVEPVDELLDRQIERLS